MSVRLLNETHARLMRGVRGADKQRGLVRRSQNWIGGTRPGNAVYVPPPPHVLEELLSADRVRVVAHERASVAAIRLFEQLPHHPIVTVASVMRLLDVSKPTAGRAIETVQAAGVLEEMTGRKRDRSWIYRSYVDQLRVGTDLLE